MFVYRLPPGLGRPKEPLAVSPDTTVVFKNSRRATPVVKDKVFLKDLSGYLAQHDLRAARLDWVKDGEGDLEAHLMTERTPAGDVYGDEFFKCPTCGCVDWWPRESDGKKLCLACVPLLPGVIETPIARKSEEGEAFFV